MDMVKRILGVFLVATGLAAAVLLMATPLIHDGSADYPLWKILNWFMAVGVVVVLVTAFLRRRALGSSEADTSELICVSLAFYGAVVLTMLFFWEWFWTFNPGNETGDAATSHMVYFPIMDALYVVLTLAVGQRLWSEGGSSES